MAKRGVQKGISTQKGQLSEKQKLAIDFYLDKNNPETFSHKTKSYVAAGYQNKSINTSSAAATRLFKSESVLKYMQQLESDRKALVNKSQIITEITAEKARNDLLDTLELCKTKGDITNLVACVRLELQITGQLSEKIVFNIEDSRKLNESHRKQAQRIASIISENRMLCTEAAQLTDSSRPIDAQFTEQSDGPDTVEDTIMADITDESPDDNISEDNDL